MACQDNESRCSKKHLACPGLPDQALCMSLAGATMPIKRFVVLKRATSKIEIAEGSRNLACDACPVAIVLRRGYSDLVSRRHCDEAKQLSGNGKLPEGKTS